MVLKVCALCLRLNRSSQGTNPASWIPWPYFPPIALPQVPSSKGIVYIHKVSYSSLWELFRHLCAVLSGWRFKATEDLSPAYLPSVTFEHAPPPTSPNTTFYSMCTLVWTKFGWGQGSPISIFSHLIWVCCVSGIFQKVHRIMILK